MKLLNYLLIIITSPVLVCSAHAQEYYFSIQAGLNSSDLNLKSASGTNQLTSPSAGFGLGASVGYNLNENFALELQPMYVEKKTTQMATTANPNITFAMTFIEIPLLLKVSTGNTIRPYLKAGPTIGFLLRAEAESEDGGVVSGQSYKADLDDVLKNVNFSLVLGAGVSFHLGQSQIFIEGQYHKGLLDLYQGGQIEWKSAEEILIVKGNEAAELYTSGIVVVMGISFPIY